MQETLLGSILGILSAGLAILLIYLRRKVQREESEKQKTARALAEKSKQEFKLLLFRRKPDEAQDMLYDVIHRLDDLGVRSQTSATPRRVEISRSSQGTMYLPGIRSK